MAPAPPSQPDLEDCAHTPALDAIARVELAARRASGAYGWANQVQTATHAEDGTSDLTFDVCRQA